MFLANNNITTGSSGNEQKMIHNLWKMANKVSFEYWPYQPISTHLLIMERKYWKQYEETSNILSKNIFSSKQLSLQRAFWACFFQGDTEWSGLFQQIVLGLSSSHIIILILGVQKIITSRYYCCDAYVLLVWCNLTNWSVSNMIWMGEINQ
jgi:hypothetical protein